MAEQKKLEAWAEKLLDTGKRNNLISFRDTKISTAEILVPDCESVFSRCSVGHVFEIADPKIPDDSIDEVLGVAESTPVKKEKLSRSEYKAEYSRLVKNEKTLLVYAQTSNPIKAVRNIAKRAKERLDETGINVAYLAFGFLRWSEKEDSSIFYKAPLLLVHVNLVIGSILEPVKIEISDDDVIVNPTFSYYLQANYGFSLPEIEECDTLITYYQKVVYLVSKLKWEVVDECKLGIFSFLKINMYEDLKKNGERILANKNIQKLLGEQSTVVEAGIPTTGNGLVVKNPLIELHTVVDADSSQIEAIKMAKSGESFVLQGPPGTGKSQTITNIIAECLYDGKKVLFVSEKQAALNVVYDKLKKAGLADFCLELHSHKANKKTVIGELNRTLELPKSGVSSSVDEEIRQKSYAQSKLDEYANALHQERSPIGKSLFQLIELHSAYRTYPEIPVKIKDIQNKGQEFLNHSVQLLEQYADFVPSIGEDYRENAWYGTQIKGITFDERERLKSDLGIVVDSFARLSEIADGLRNKYDVTVTNYSETVRWRNLLSLLADSNVYTPRILVWKEYCETIPRIKSLQKMSEFIVPVRDGLLNSFVSDTISDLNGAEIYAKLTGEYQSTFSRVFSKEYKSMMLTIQSYLKNPVKLKYKQAVDFANQLKQLQQANVAFGEYALNVEEYLGDCYNGPDTDWNHVLKSLELLRPCLEEGHASMGILPSLSCDTFRNSCNDFSIDNKRISEELYRVKESLLFVQRYFSLNSLNLETDFFSVCNNRLLKCLDSFDQLSNWIGFDNLLTLIEKQGLSKNITEIIDSKTEPKNIVGAFRRAFYRRWIEYLFFKDEVIASFTRAAQDQAVKIFSEKDVLQYEISKVQIKAELSQKRPNIDLIASGGAPAVLRREAGKKKKQMPIRKLINNLGAFVQILKPCFLMSPLSVSTFLDSDGIQFDTVVFDEASQIFPQDAIGAIYRGKQLIVVGDSKQMPPSNFFSSFLSNDEEDEEAGDVTDFESILDICSVAFTTERLRWHYRSHYEQLIAFSNLYFYNNTLVTFPSVKPDQKGIGVDFYHVDGVFDRKSKTNKAEAEFIVDLVFENIEKYPERSLGVVAFSLAQQNLIDLLIAKRREKKSEYEWFFSEERPEPFFVKNLETVQGDERDSIIFSIAYAKDAQGRFIHNFGPLNREGGERRLNVAVTRAKDSVQLVSSIRYTDINLNNTESQGVRLLRSYLDYAENGETALERTSVPSEVDQFDSAFELEVCEFLRDNGFTVDTQVGCSGYRIDLGLKNPNSSEYLLAIECDGATYHSSKNARDRDSLRQRVLERMGWRFYRIWSTDWIRNQVVEKQRLLKAARDAVAGVLPTQGEQGKEVKKNNKSVGDRFTIEVDKTSVAFKEYVELDADAIYRKNRGDIVSTILEIVEKEAPISAEYLLKRLVRFFNRDKVTIAVWSEFYGLMLDERLKSKVRYRDLFLYWKGQNEFVLRVPGAKRKIDYIPIEELEQGFLLLIQQNTSIPEDDLYKAMNGLLGYSRLGGNIIYWYETALKKLCKKGIVRKENESWVVAK